ncbi:MAG TPA: hypothetical protein PLV93_07065 [Microthrixaceae bacterium]|nr:hypothetical protein [Microthrixaceae bacterium]
MTRRRLAFLVGAATWIGLGVVLLVVIGGASGFLPADPTVPTVGFASNADGTHLVVIGPESWPEVEGIEIRSGNQPLEGRLLWAAKRTGPRPAPSPNESTTVEIGIPPPGFDETHALGGDLPRLWHAEVDNRCFYGSAVAPDSTTTDSVTLEDGQRVTAGGFAAADRGFSACDESTFGGRLAALLGILSIGIGGVLLIVTWWDWRRGLPPEMTGAAAQRPESS